MPTPQLSPRLRSVCKCTQDDVVLVDEHTVRIRVIDIDRVYRDAIKAGATPVRAPEDVDRMRTASVIDAPTGTRIELIEG